MMNMANQNACEELHASQVAEIFSDFLGVHNKQWMCGFMASHETPWIIMGIKNAFATLLNN